MPLEHKAGTILVIKLGALGDVVLALPPVARIQAAHPGRCITVLTAPEYAPLFAALPDVDVVAFPRKGFIPMARLLRWLFAQRVEVVYDLQGSLRSRIMTLLTQAPVRVGGSAAFAYTHAPPKADATRLHACDRLNRLLATVGIEPADPYWRMQVLPAAQSRVTDWLHGHGLAEQSLVLLHAGSSPRWPSKRWPAAHFRELALALAGRGLHVIWLGGADDAELNRTLGSATGTDASGEFSYPELAALARHAEFAVTNDSGPMHMLATAGLPVYACFGPTDWRRSHAQGQAERVLTSDADCSPCQLQVCPPQRRHVCMRDLLPARVLARLQADGFLKSE
jgi:ADP-heptose:LPS heptosyltransferase